MKALVKREAKPGLWMMDQPIPSIGHNDVLIKIKKTAICGTDIHIYKWDEWAEKTIKVPMIIGHEFVGEIVDMGSEVTGFKVGDRVSGEGHIPCNFCRNCRAGRKYLCRNHQSVGVTRTGCFAEYLALPAANAFLLSDSIPDNIAAFLDPFGNATHTALSFDLVGEDVLINGAGPIGCMCVAIAKHVGARHVVITDINDYRLKLAKEMGATRAVNVKHEKLQDVIRELKMTEGFDVGLEVSGNADAFNSMLETIVHGGRIALLGFLPRETKIDWNHLIMKGLILKGIYGREIFETWYKMEAMLQSGLNISPILTHQFSVDDFEKAFAVMLSGESGKVVMSWE